MMSDTTPTPADRQRSLFSRVSFPAPLSADRLHEIEADGWMLTATVRGPDGQPREYLFMRRGEDPTPPSP
jgi:hypothetical protein